jgi:hypothetical protein
VVASAAALAGCGLGPGPATEGVAELTVTRDYGAVPMTSAELNDPRETETVLTLLDRETEIETRYGGGFVNSIDGVEGSVVEDGRTYDWFFYVNGIESGVGSADRRVAGGDRIWWDHRDWSDALRVPAVVGSWPEPFLQASDATPAETHVQCAGVSDTCEAVRRALGKAGATAIGSRPGAETETARVLVGTWETINDDPAASLLARNPSRSGVFARFEEGPDGFELVALDERATESVRLGRGAGLVAATRDGDEPPTWFVTGVDEAGVTAAVDALSSDVLEDRYAVAVGAGSDAALALPVQESE